mgnify:CR=1 FL=1
MPRTRNPLTTHVRAIRRALTVIDRSLEKLVAAAQSTKRASAVAQPKRKLKLTAKRRAELKLQGQYMGYVRPLKPRQKAQVKAVREKKGMKAAIKAAKRLASQ